MSRYRVLAWLICLPLLPVVYCVGLWFIARDLWRRKRSAPAP